MAKQACFLIQTEDRKGVLAEISGFFASHAFNVLECKQYSDMRENRYYMRVVIDLEKDSMTRRALSEAFDEVAVRMNLKYSLHFSDDRCRMAILVSKTSHCLYDLLAHVREGDLPCEVPLVIGNHPELEHVADMFNIPYFCCPVEPDRGAEQEKAVLEILQQHKIDLVVLARYMRILSENFIEQYQNRIINIHHAFLPAFQGGNPYMRAWQRGVKMIGATAHYATPELDEGPIIEQDVERITHEASPDELKQIGKDIERRVLTRAVRAHLEHRVIITGRRTIVFAR
ncbi:MAG: formyltetrahydrofolate deformylase [Lentisphaeria bacterium]|nr:formyltetrahydrofolate deformylase [Lentisphaeria bacterium]